MIPGKISFDARAQALWQPSEVYQRSQTLFDRGICLKFTSEAKKEIDKFQETWRKIDDIRSRLVAALGEGDVDTARRCLDEWKKLKITK